NFENVFKYNFQRQNGTEQHLSLVPEGHGFIYSTGSGRLEMLRSREKCLSHCSVAVRGASTYQNRSEVMLLKSVFKRHRTRPLIAESQRETRLAHLVFQFSHWQRQCQTLEMFPFDDFVSCDNW
ncbi:hypothetical protein AVEN_151234-1, partial [Araneus ventricosus]